MPITPSYPGVYVEEIPTGSRTITGVSTSVTAFIGYFTRGTMNEPETVLNFGDFEREFGGLHRKSEASYAINQFFQNGGTEALIIRTAKNSQAAVITLTEEGSDDEVMTIEAANPGKWGNNLRVDVDYQTTDPNNENLFNLEVGEYSEGSTLRSERFHNLSLHESSPRFVESVVNDGSTLIRIKVPDGVLSRVSNQADNDNPLLRPVATSDWQYTLGVEGASRNQKAGKLGKDGDLPGTGELKGDREKKTGIYALEDADIFNILCIPRTAELQDSDAIPVIDAGISYCADQRAFMIVDIPNDEDSVDGIQTWVKDHTTALRRAQADHAALYFPRVRVSDPLNEYRPRSIPASGTLAGLYARTDTDRGVWKAPAGTEATLRGVRSLEYKLSDAENGRLNPEGINALRTLPVYGNISWGGRTLRGKDQLADEYKYIPVRRLALFLEESLFRGLQWVVFEPNDEPLWAQIRANVNEFMQRLFRQGAFQGTSPSEAYFVKCDSETTTQGDIDRGIVNIVVGFAPLKPAEFVILKIQQKAGQE